MVALAGEGGQKIRPYEFTGGKLCRLEPLHGAVLPIEPTDLSHNRVGFAIQSIAGGRLVY